jgi:penicillin-binding protein 2
MLASQVSPEIVSRVRERQSELPGVMLVPDSVRTYPFGDLASHTIGYINSIPGRLEKQYVERGGFPPDAKIGWGGVEKAYDDILRGHPGRIRVEISSTGVPRRILSDSAAAVRG